MLEYKVDSKNQSKQTKILERLTHLAQMKVPQHLKEAAERQISRIQLGVFEETV